MKFCKECGKQLADDALFCNECGTSVEGGQSAQPTPPVQTVPRKPMSKKAKRMWIAIGAALIILFGVHKLVDSLMSKDRLIEKFESALIEGDGKAVANLLSSNDKKLKIDEKSVSGLMKYFKENPDQVKEVVSTLEAQSRLIDNAKKEKKTLVDEFAEGFLGYGLVSLEQDGKFLFYDKYDLNIESVYLTLETNYKDTVLFVDGKEVGKADTPDFESTYGPFLPGYHTIKGELKTDFIELKKEEDIFMHSTDNKVNAGIYFDAEEVTIDLPTSENTEGTAKLFLNGKDVGVNLYENSTFGPVLTDGSMTFYVEAQLPWGTVKTEESTINDNYLEVSFINNDLQTTLMETIHTYNQEWAKAYTSVDASSMTTATATIQEQILEEATNFKENNYAVEIEYLGSVFNLDSFELYNQDGTWEAYVSVLRHMNRDYFYVGDDRELDEVNESDFYRLTFDEEEKKWLVYEISSTWGFDNDNSKELKVEEPQSYVSTWLKDKKKENKDE